MATKNTGPKGQCMCRNLRSQEMYYEDRPDPNSLFSSGSFWCQLTHDAVGPDGKGVDYLECEAGRECFEQ